MNKDVLEFIAEYKLNPQHFFDAKGQTLTSDVKDQMRKEEKIFAFNTSACNNGHNIKFNIEDILCFTLESLAEAMKEYVDNGYKSEWEK